MAGVLAAGPPVWSDRSCRWRRSRRAGKACFRASQLTWIGLCLRVYAVRPLRRPAPMH